MKGDRKNDWRDCCASARLIGQVARSRRAEILTDVGGSGVGLTVMPVHRDTDTRMITLAPVEMEDGPFHDRGPTS
jgi:hypothetical protein